MQDNEANAAPAADAQQPTPENQALMEMYDVFLEELGEGEQFENVMNDIAGRKFSPLIQLSPSSCSGPTLG
jgi:hypothetical protein